MVQVLGALFLVGLFVNLVKGADLILRPHQQAWLQRKFETFTLHISDIKPLRWFTLISGPAILWILVFFIGYPVAKEFGMPIFRITEQTNVVVWLGFIVFAFILFRHVKTMPKQIVDYLAGRDFRDQGKTYSFGTFLGRFCRIIFLCVLFCFVFSLINYIIFKLAAVIIEGKPFTFDADLYRISFIPTWPILFFVMALVIIGSIIIAATTLLLILEVVLILLRGLCWRIAEYNKGVWAAITLIITVIIGTVEFYLKFGK